MDKKQMPISELPFNFDGLEPQYGQIKHAELICPGVYFIMTKFNTDRPRFAGEYLVVTEDSPAISPEARNFTTPLPTIPRMFLCEYDYDCKGRHVVEYEAHKYLVEHGLPLPEGESLEEARAFGREVCPEYFGQLPVPTDTPWGPPLRHDRLGNGLYWLETEHAGWGLALAYPIREDLMFHTRVFAALMPTDRERGLDNTFGYCFYPFEVSCIPLFELLEYGERDWADKIDIAALKNAILKFYPDYLKPDL